MTFNVKNDVIRIIKNILINVKYINLIYIFLLHAQAIFTLLEFGKIINVTMFNHHLGLVK